MPRLGNARKSTLTTMGTRVALFRLVGWLSHAENYTPRASALGMVKDNHTPRTLVREWEHLKVLPGFKSLATLFRVFGSRSRFILEAMGLSESEIARIYRDGEGAGAPLKGERRKLPRLLVEFDERKDRA